MKYVQYLKRIYEHCLYCSEMLKFSEVKFNVAAKRPQQKKIKYLK